MKLSTIYKRLGVEIGAALFFALFFVFIGVPLSRIDDMVIHDQDFIKDLIAVFVVVLSVLAYIRTYNTYLDRKYTWHHNFTRRLLYQFLGGIIAPAVFIWVYIYSYRVLILNMPSPQMEQFSSSDYPVSIIVIIFLNLCCIGYFFYRESQEKHSMMIALEQELFTLKTLPSATGLMDQVKTDQSGIYIKPKIRILIAALGNKNIPIPVEDIAYIYKQGNYIELKTFKKTNYLLNHTLEELMQLLNETQFFRANRQCIVNLYACHFFTNEENGKLALHLIPEYKDEVIISQKRAQLFKDWLHKSKES